jgi:hypothetical protein
VTLVAGERRTVGSPPTDRQTEGHFKVAVGAISVLVLLIVTERQQSHRAQSYEP